MSRLQTRSAAALKPVPPLPFQWEVSKIDWSILGEEPLSVVARAIKRVIDLTISVPALVLLLPFCFLIALAIKRDSKGPVLYKSLRVGKRGRTFECYKFRSMVADADKSKERLRKRNERHGPTFKMANDPRITPLGRFIRRYSIDEIPQLYNVIRGDMSIVGPRPHPIDDVVRYSPVHLQRCIVMPGLTCLWQILARKSPSFEINMELDLEYIREWSLLLDMKIILRTFTVVLKGEGM